MSHLEELSVNANARTWCILGLFALLVAFLGGASRSDAMQIALLRPLSALFMLTYLVQENRQENRKALPIGVFLGLAAILMAIQLVPLPPSVWHALPLGESIDQIDIVLGLEGVWRPITMAPSRTLNSLLSICVPIVAYALVYFNNLKRDDALFLIAGLVTVDSLLGLGQVLSGRNSPLYLYEITNRGAPVGIFANENHSTVFSVLGLLVFTRLGLSRFSGKNRAFFIAWFVIGFGLTLLAVLISGSRAGLALAGFSLLVSLIMFFLARIEKTPLNASSNRLLLWLSRADIVLLALIVSVAVMILLFFQLERTPAFADLSNHDPFANIRWQIGPILQNMVSDFWLTGSGIGSFEKVYHFYEPSNLLLPRYVNQAHNDWAQLFIEGGLPAAALILAILYWVIARIITLFRESSNAMMKLVFWTAILIVICSASIVDYPLRTPSFQVVTIWLLYALAVEPRPARNGKARARMRMPKSP
ncbi:O-antigen ligase family protein [Alterisphingorhabdus coralli]|uniref:O-antigen ligase family protein n=1 Tax=Alterisphingorhabdus coralli TaxID=3071408 RepID=A0AA97HZK4_9SPHN|nr:O-antigen ligase family protein [Parasphingorhabdus sp. SCSIO 66989]WOE74809.1 O-antigen ligase family protein [Parasphingorhabdus sp. SCSIO 66989]